MRLSNDLQPRLTYIYERFTRSHDYGCFFLSPTGQADETFTTLLNKEMGKISQTGQNLPKIFLTD